MLTDLTSHLLFNREQFCQFLKAEMSLFRVKQEQVKLAYSLLEHSISLIKHSESLKF